MKLGDQAQSEWARAVSEAWAITLGQRSMELADGSRRSARRARGRASLSSGIPASRTRRRSTVRRVARLGASTGDGQAPTRSGRGAGRPASRAGQKGCGPTESTSMAAALIEGVEGMEELLFGVRLPFEELDVVDEQHVQVPVALLERLAALQAQRVHELVGERLRGRCSGCSGPGRWRAGSSRLRQACGSCPGPEARGGRAGCRPPRGPRPRRAPRRERSGCRRRSRSARRRTAWIRLILRWPGLGRREADLCPDPAGSLHGFRDQGRVAPLHPRADSVGGGDVQRATARAGGVPAAATRG